MGCAIKSPHHINMVIQQRYACTWKEGEQVTTTEPKLDSRKKTWSLTAS